MLNYEGNEFTGTFFEEEDQERPVVVLETDDDNEDDRLKLWMMSNSIRPK